MAAPANDNWANAQLISGASGTVAVSTTDATVEPDEGNTGLNSVWLKWTAPTTGRYRFADSQNTGTGFPVQVFRGATLSTLSECSHSEPFGIRYFTHVLHAEAGVEYSIRFRNGNGNANQYGVNRTVVWSQETRPANDDFADATPIGGATNGTVPLDFSNATIEDFERAQLGTSSGPSVWYQWTAPARGRYSFRTSRGDPDDRIAVYKGTTPSLLVVVNRLNLDTSDYDFCTVGAQTGETFYLKAYIRTGTAVSGLTVSWSLSGAAPANDNFADAQNLGNGATGTQSYSTQYATGEASEPAINSPAGLNPPVPSQAASAWFKWTAPTTKRMQWTGVNAAYSGTSLSGLGANLMNVDKRFDAVAGTTYFLSAISPVASGTYFWPAESLSWTATTGPANDDFSNAISISGDRAPVLAASPSGRGVAGTNVGATTQTGEPFYRGETVGNTRSVWYGWTAPSTGRFEFRILGSTTDDNVAVTTGTSVSALTRISGAAKTIRFDALAGQNYNFAVVDEYNSGSAFYLDWNPISKPTNDLVANAQDLGSASSGSVAGSNVGSITNTTDLSSAVWFKWTAPDSKRYRFWITDSTNHRTYVGQTPNSAGNTLKISDWNGRFNAQSGTTYYIPVGSATEGTFTLNWAPAPPPANYLKSSAITISGENGSVLGNNFNATGPDAEVWYVWTAPKSGTWKFSLAANPLAPTLQDLQILDANSTVIATGIYGNSSSNAFTPATFNATVGTTYFVRVWGRNSGTSYQDNGHPIECPFDLRWRAAPAPPNDNLAGAQVISGQSGTVVGTTLDSTNEGQNFYPFSDVWYRFTPTVTGRYTFTLDPPANTISNGAYKYVRTVYNGNINNPAILDDKLGRFKMVAGTTYDLKVVGKSEDADTFTLRWSFLPIPPNDDFLNAQILPATAPALSDSATGTGVRGTTLGASDETYIPASQTNVWYKWTAPATGRYRFQLVGLKNGATVVAPAGSITVSTGASVSSQTEVASANNASQARFNATAGTVYNVCVKTNIEKEADFVFDFAALIPPSNDPFAGAQMLSGGSGTVNGTTIAASNETGESYVTSSSSVWYKWTAPTTARYRISLSAPVGSIAYYVQINVFSGSAVNALTKVDDAKHAFSATSGTTYYFSASSSSAETEAAFTLDWQLVTPPSNDNFVNALVLPNTPSGSQGGTTLYSTVESGEPRALDSGSQGPGVWYRFTPAQSGTYRFRMNGTEPGNAYNGYAYSIGAFTGSPVNALTRVPATSAYAYSPTYTLLGTDYTMSLLAGTTYSLHVDANYPAFYGDGPFQMDWTRTNPPPNDNFALAQLLTGNSGDVTGTTQNGTAQSGEPGSPTRSIWYQWVAPSSALVGFQAVIRNTQNSEVNSRLRVYTGTAVNALTAVNISTSGNGTSAEWMTTSGTTYYISLDGDEGNSRLTWGYLARPANDDFQNAQLITGSTGTTTGTLLRATIETGEVASDKTVWYQWVGGTQKRMRMSVSVPFGEQASVEVFTGVAVNALTKVSDRRQRFLVTQGTTYFIAVSGSGSSNFSLDWEPVVPPGNDDYLNGQAISGLQAPLYPGSDTGRAVAGQTIDATREIGETAGIVTSVWYAWTCGGSGTYTFTLVKGNVNGTPPHPVTDFTLSNHSLTAMIDAVNLETATQVGAAATNQALVFRASKGTIYRIAVSVAVPSDGQYEDYFLLDWNRTERGPLNDDLSDEETIVGLSGTLDATNVNALEERGETTPGGASVWYRWTAPATGTVTFDTQGSALDTILTAHEGINLNFRDLQVVQSDDDSLGKQSRISFDAVKDRVYHIAVSGHGEPIAEMGAFKLNWLQIERPALNLSLSKTVIAENAGANAATLTVTRTGNISASVRVAFKITTGDNLAPRFTLPAFVDIPASQNSITVQIDALDDLFAYGTQSATILATAPLLTSATQTLQITDNERPLLTLVPSAAPYLEGLSVRFTLTRNTPVKDAMLVNLSASPLGVLTIPATISIPAGKASVTFDARTINDTLALGNRVVTVLAKAGTLSATSKITITDAQKPTLSLSVYPVAIPENATTTLTGTVSRNTATTKALTVKLVSSDLSEARVPLSVVIPAGKTSATFPVTPVDDLLFDGTQRVTLSASATGFVLPATFIISVTDNDLAALTLSIAPNRFAESGAATATLSRNTEIKINTPALAVAIVPSIKSQLDLPATVQIPVGKASVTFAVKGINNTLSDGPRIVTVTASAPRTVAGKADVTILDDEAASVGRLSGRITKNGVALAGVQVTLKSGSRVVDIQTSSSTGAYVFSGLALGTYSVVPTSSALRFDPTSRAATLTTTATSLASLDFAAKPPLDAPSSVEVADAFSPTISVVEPSAGTYNAATIGNLRITGTLETSAPDGKVVVSLARFSDKDAAEPNAFFDWNDAAFITSPSDSTDLQASGFARWTLNANRILRNLPQGVYGVRVVAFDAQGNACAPVWKRFVVSDAPSVAGS